MTAAFLHDTVEDTPTTLMEIKNKFGNLVASLVKELTSDSDKIKKLGKTEYLSNKMTEELTDYALVLKLADRLDNVSDFPKATASFVEKYKKETNSILNKLEERDLTGTQKKLIAAIKEKLK
jgi:(p)ppGpp synthase/HD superfamily hydrolase